MALILFSITQRSPPVYLSQNQAEAHYRGHKHARRLKAIEAVKNKHKTADNSSSSQEKMANFEAALDISRDTTTNSSRGKGQADLGRGILLDRF